MIINSEPSTNTNLFYHNNYVNQLVDLALWNIEDKIFLDILNLISTYNNINTINRLLLLFKYDADDSKIQIYDQVKLLLDNIYLDKDKDNLRGVFLELLTFKYLNNNFPIIKSDLDCHVVIDGVKCKKTVDVFALWEYDGFISECKINHKYFEDHDLSTLNTLYFNSEKKLSPYIITLASEDLINEKLNEIALEDDTNIIVHWAYLNVISIDNIHEFFS